MICKYPACQRITVNEHGICTEHIRHVAQFIQGAATLAEAWTGQQTPEERGDDDTSGN